MSEYKPKRWETAYDYTDGVFHRDNLITSFPKSGRTWIILFFQYYNRYSGSKKEVSTTHHTSSISYKKNLLLIRNPCDVFVSLYFHKKFRVARKLPAGFGEFIKAWLPVFNDSHEKWAKYTDNKMVIRYEDLFESITWEKILEHFDIVVNRRAFDRAINKTKFDNIKNNLRETKSFKNWYKYVALERGHYVVNPKDNNAHKFRRGKPGGYVDYLSKEEVEFVKDNFDLGDGLEDHTKYYKEVFEKYLEGKK